MGDRISNDMVKKFCELNRVEDEKDGEKVSSLEEIRERCEVALDKVGFVFGWCVLGKDHAQHLANLRKDVPDLFSRIEQLEKELASLRDTPWAPVSNPPKWKYLKP